MGRVGGQGAALAISVLWEIDPPPRTPSSPPSGNLESHHPHPPSASQDELNQAAGQMDKPDAKVGVRPEGSSRPGQEPQSSPGTNGHMDGHAGQRTWR